MPLLNWIGKEKIVNHDKEVPFRLLKKVEKYSLGKDSENLIIEGDNLEALKALMPYYVGQVKCIYIDPPYNTGNEGWVYNDSVNAPKIKDWLGKVVGGEGEDLTRHDKWLCMMYPRLKLLRDLLREDGVIFISIDDNEHCHLKIIMDEIFGAENFIASLPRRTKSAGKTTGAIALNNDYVLIYTKNKKLVNFSAISIDDKAYKFKDEYFEERGPYALSQTLDYDSLSYSPSLDYELFLANRKFYPGNSRDAFLKRKAGKHRASDWTWRWSKNLVDFGNKNGFLVIKQGKNKEQRIYTKTYYKVNIQKIDGAYKIIPIDRTKNLSTLDLMESVYSNDVAKKDIRIIFGALAEFSYPKPLSLIKYLIKAISDTKDVIVLDSFAGSGTTGQAVLELNKEDGGSRKFILVELEKEIAQKITSERVRRVSKDLKGHFAYEVLSEPLFNANGTITEEVSYNQFAQYIYFTETHTNLNIKEITNPKVGEHNETEYYLIYKKPKENLLDKSFLKNVKKNKIQKVVYADKCALSDKTLEEYGIIFKQIPYEVKVY